SHPLTVKPADSCRPRQVGASPVSGSVTDKRALPVRAVNLLISQRLKAEARPAAFGAPIAERLEWQGTHDHTPSRARGPPRPPRPSRSGSPRMGRKQVVLLLDFLLLFAGAGRLGVVACPRALPVWSAVCSPALAPAAPAASAWRWRRWSSAWRPHRC